MSLLIKALQKAEQGKGSEKKTDIAAGDSSPSDLSLEVDSTGLTLELEDAVPDSERASKAVKQEQGKQKQASQQAAATMFTAKNTGVQSAQSPKTISKKAGLLVGATFFGLLLIGGAFYLYLNSLQQPELVLLKSAGSSSPAPGADTGVAATATDLTVKSARAQDASSTTPASSTANETATTPEKVTELDAKSSSDDSLDERSPLEKRSPSRSSRIKRSQALSFGEPVVPNEDTSVKVKRNASATGVNPNLLAAYQAFNAGDDATAQRLYRQVLQGDIRNVDALLGMAAIASRQNRNDDAAGWYGKVLEVEPRNTIAQAAMVGVYSQTDPVGSESRIKNMLARQPEAAHLHAALGDLYVEQKQWALAQQAYFQAHHLDANNADYAFNLAVSLDQMGKPALALPYYKRALELLAISGAGNIDRAQLESRISQLQ